jgi:hypothetical protein
MAFAIQKSATVDAGIAATWATVGAVDILNASMPTGTGSSDWYTVTLTVAIPNDGTANSLRFYLDSGTIPNGGYYEIAEAQLEVGSVATPFSRAAGTLQGELAACQRYYWRTSSMGPNAMIANGHATSTNNIRYTVKHPVTMRTTPFSLEWLTIRAGDGATDLTPSAITLTSGAQSGETAMVDLTVTGATQFRPYYLYANGTSSYLGISAEL